MRSATKPPSRATAPEIATPVTPSFGAPSRPKRRMQLPMTLRMLTEPLTNMASRVRPWARSTADMATFWASRNRVPPRMVRNGRA